MSAEQGIASRFANGKRQGRIGWSLAVAVAATGILAAALPNRAGAQTVVAPTGGYTTGGYTTGGSSTTSGSTTGGAASGGAASATMPGSTTITLDAFAQMLLDEIQMMLIQEFGPIPPELMDFLTDLILREFFLGGMFGSQQPSTGSTTTPATAAMSP